MDKKRLFSPLTACWICLVGHPMYKRLRKGLLTFCIGYIIFKVVEESFRLKSSRTNALSQLNAVLLLFIHESSQSKM